jgi:hypothetical protein
MSDFLTNLVRRNRGPMEAIQPRVPSLYEPYRRDNGVPRERGAGSEPASEPAIAPDSESDAAIARVNFRSNRQSDRQSDHSATPKSEPRRNPIAHLTPDLRPRAPRPDARDGKSEDSEPTPAVAEKTEPPRFSRSVPSALVPGKHTPPGPVAEFPVSGQVPVRHDSSDNSSVSQFSRRTTLEPSVDSANAHPATISPRERAAVPLSHTRGSIVPSRAEQFEGTPASEIKTAMRATTRAEEDRSPSIQHQAGQRETARAAASRLFGDDRALPILMPAAELAVSDSASETPHPPVPAALVAHPHPLSTQPASPATPSTHNIGDAAPAPPRSGGVRTPDAAAISQSAEPSVQVSIGRVEVRAVFPEPPVRRAPSARPRTTLSLDDYLRPRTGGRR